MILKSAIRLLCTGAAFWFASCQHQPGLPENSPPLAPRLFFGLEDIASLQALTAGAEASAVLERLEIVLSQPPDPLHVSSHAAGYGFLYLLKNERRFLDSATLYVEHCISDKYLFFSTDERLKEEGGFPLWDSEFKAIYRAPNILGMAMAYDFCNAAWEAPFRNHVAKEIQDKAIKLLKGGGEGWNGNLWSNWQGIVNGAAGTALLAIGADLNTNSEENAWLDSASNRLSAHLSYLGEKGWSPEGFDYLRYEMCNGVLPFCQAHNRLSAKKLPHSAKLAWLSGLYATQTMLSAEGLLVPIYGNGGDFWNRNRWRSGDWAMSLAFSQPEVRPFATKKFIEAFGFEGDGSFDVFKPHDAVFVWLNVLGKTLGQPPSKLSDNQWIDSLAGYFVFKRQLAINEDLVFMFNTNSLARPKSHSYRDAGSFRINAFGHRWVKRGDRLVRKVEDASLENVVLVERATHWNGAGAHRLQQTDPDGLTLDIDMRPVYVAGKAVGISEDLGISRVKRNFQLKSPENGSFVLEIEDTLAYNAPSLWQMHTDPFHKTAFGKNGLKVVAHDGASMEIEVLWPKNTLPLLAGNGKITLEGTGRYHVRLIIRPKPQT